jgi:hypothetical protein
MDRQNCAGQSAEGGGVMRGWAGTAGVLLTGILAAAVSPAAAGSAVTVAAHGTRAAVRLLGPVAGLPDLVETAAITGLNGVYCTSASNCWAVGVRQASERAAVLNQVLAWNGSKWRLFPVPQPGGTGDGADSTLNSVRCLTAADCWAVGYYLKGGADLDQALHWNGTKWSRIPTPVPGGILSNDVSELNDVVCTSPANCWAAGYFGSQDTSANQALHWNGAKWSLVTTPDPAGTEAGDSNMLGSVRCTSKSACLAVGNSGMTGSTSLTLNEALRWNGKKWLVQTTPDPGGTMIDVAVNDLTGLACSSPANCWAAGSDGNLTAATTLNEILHWNGKKWLAVTVPDPDGTNPGASNGLAWDTCISASDCWTVGFYGAGSVYSNQALHWNGHKWTYVIAPDPGATAQRGDNVLTGARCITAANCWAVGFRKAGKRLVDQILHWNGKKWFAADKNLPVISER